LTPGVGGEQARLLGVGAEAAADAQEELGFLTSGGRYAVERERDVKPHWLPLCL
jgi:hypothetical protein